MFSQCSYWRCRSSVTLHCVTVNNPWHTYIHTHTHIYTYIYYIHTHTYTYIHTHIHNTYIYTHIYTYIHTYIHTYTHTYIHTYISKDHIAFILQNFSIPEDLNLHDYSDNSNNIDINYYNNIVKTAHRRDPSLTSNKQSQQNTVREESSKICNFPRRLDTFHETEVQNDPW